MEFGWGAVSARRCLGKEQAKGEERRSCQTHLVLGVEQDGVVVLFVMDTLSCFAV